MPEPAPDRKTDEHPVTSGLLWAEAENRARQLRQSVERKADQQAQLSDPAEFQAALKGPID